MLQVLKYREHIPSLVITVDRRRGSLRKQCQETGKAERDDKQGQDEGKSEEGKIVFLCLFVSVWRSGREKAMHKSLICASCAGTSITLCTRLPVCARWLIFHFSGRSCLTEHPYRHDLTQTNTQTTLLKVSNKFHRHTQREGERENLKLLGKERKMSCFQKSYYFSTEHEIASDCDLWDKVLTLLLWDAIYPWDIYDQHAVTRILHQLLPRNGCSSSRSLSMWSYFRLHILHIFSSFSHSCLLSLRLMPSNTTASYVKWFIVIVTETSQYQNEHISYQTSIKETEVGQP